MKQTTYDTYSAHIMTWEESFSPTFLNWFKNSSWLNWVNQFFTWKEVIEDIKNRIAVIVSLWRLVDNYDNWNFFLDKQDIVCDDWSENNTLRIFKECNEAIIKMDFIPENILAFVNIAWKYPEKFLPYIKEYKSLFKGVKILASLCISVNDNKLDEIYKFCEENNWPVIVHCSHEESSHLNIWELIKVAKRFPWVKFIASHMGWDNPEIIKKVTFNILKEKKYKNLFFNTAIKNYEALEDIVKRLWPWNIVFARDYPFLWDKHEESIIKSIWDHFDEVFIDTPKKIFDI